MKTKKLAAMLITVSMVLGSMSGLVWADTETDSTEPSTEQVTEITDETSEETESSEATEEVEEIEVEEEEAEETEASEEIDETIETEADEDIAVEEEGDVYEAEDGTTAYVSDWSEFVAALTPGASTPTTIVLRDDIYATPNAAPITIHGGLSVEEIDLGGFSINLSTNTSGSFYINYVRNNSLTIENGEITGGCNSTGVGFISNSLGGTVTLEDLTITRCSSYNGVVNLVNGTLNLINTSITDNTSVNGHSGVLCNPNTIISFDGKVEICGNHSDASTPNNNFDNLHFYGFDENNPILIGENFSYQSDICISGVNPGTEVTSGWNHRSYSYVFSFSDGLDAVLDGNEVYTSSISYLSRSWNETSEEVVPNYVTIDDNSEFTHITADAFDPTKGISGTIYIYEDMVVADRIYVTEGETLNIVIADGVTLTCNGGIGVHSIPVEGSSPIISSLHIYGQTNNDTGVLIASAPNGINCAGIGGSTVGTTYYDCGEVYISGCTVTATGNNAAGIGGITSYIEETETRNIVHGTNFQKVEIYGGNVTAIGGGDYGDDIGTGLDGAKGSGSVGVYGGIVTLPHVNGYQIGVDYYHNITLAPNLCVFNGEEYCVSTDEGREQTLASYIYYTVVISPCLHPNKADVTLYIDDADNDDTHIYNCPYCVSDSGIVQPHTFDNGYCICGHHYTEASGCFVGHAMQLSGQIGLQFYFNLPVGAEASDYSVSFLGNGIDETREYSPIESTKTSYGAYYVQLDLNPIQMADHFTPVLHLEGSDVPVETGRAYCAMDYITWARTASLVQQTERDILESLADYGFYSQIYLSGIDGWSIGTDHEAIDLGRAPHSYARDTYMGYTEDYVAKIGTDVATWCDRVSLSVRFGDQLMLRAVFYPAEGQTFSRSDFSVVETSNYSVSRRSDGAFVVTILDKISVMNVLAPAGADDPVALYHFQIKNGSSTGIVTVSPMSYAYSIIKNLENSQGCRNLVCALYDYAYACNQYRAQVTSN